MLKLLSLSDIYVTLLIRGGNPVAFLECLTVKAGLTVLLPPSLGRFFYVMLEHDEAESA